MNDINELPEYTSGNYPSFGKKYNGEKAVISLTSWTLRINTVSKTLYSLIQQCPDFHIVLVLAEEEFPKMTAELPENLMLFVENELIELMFVRKNYRSFKKILFTMDKYREVPIISADDGCFYVKNYAQELYDEWTKFPLCIISEYNAGTNGFRWGGGGHGLLFPPYRFLNRGIYDLTDDIIKTNHDDAYYGVLAKRLNINFHFIHKRHENPKTHINIDSNGLTADHLFKNSDCLKIKEEILSL